MLKIIRKIIRLWKMPDPDEHYLELYLDEQRLLSVPFTGLMFSNVMQGKKNYTLKFHNVKFEIPSDTALRPKEDHLSAESDRF